MKTPVLDALGEAVLDAAQALAVDAVRFDFRLGLAAVSLGFDAARRDELVVRVDDIFVIWRNPK